MGRKVVLAIDEVAKSNYVGPLVVCGAVFVGNKKFPKEFVDSKKCRNSNLEKTFSEYVRFTDAFAVEFVPETILDSSNVIDAEIVVIKKIISMFNPDLVLLDYLGRSKEKIASNLHIVENKIIYEPQLDQKRFEVACASVIAKYFRDAWFESLNLGFSDYNYKVLDKLGFEKSLQIPHVRKRWVKSYFKSKYGLEVDD